MNSEKQDRIIRKTELLSIIPLSHVTIWRMEKAGKFPKRVQIGGNAVGWLVSEVNQWMKQKAEARI
jgi:prophage regulatory protein